MACSSIPVLGWILVFFCLSSLVDRKSSVAASRVNFVNPDLTNTNSIASTQYRSGYHFQPRKNWINDPNGPLYYNGFYHLFYQYNPYAAIWGNISWGHSVSTDLIQWTGLEVALSPINPYDKNGCFSGSATILPGNKPVIIYTGVDEKNRQVQNIAYPKNLSDPMLHEWIKYDHNPVMEPVDGLNAGQFRDPTTGWLGRDGLWRVVVGAEIGLKGQAMLYRSKDFVQWARAENPLHATNGSRMWECPDFYSLKGNEKKYVLKMSLGETVSDHYMLGQYDEEKDVFVRDEPSDDYRMWRRYDYGKFYASKSFFDEKQRRRILWGWVNESDSVTDDNTKGWSGIQTFPRVVSLDDNGRQLLQWPIKELESFRRKQGNLHDIELETGGLVEVEGLKVSEADVEVEFELLSLKTAEPFNDDWVLDPPMLCREKGASVNGGVGPFGLLVLASRNLEEHTAIFFRVFKSGEVYKVLMCSDLRRSSLRAEVDKPAYGAFVDIEIKNGGKISLKALIDHSIVECFGAGGKTCITSRVYPTLLVSGGAHLYAFNNGTESVKISDLKAWSMDRPKIS